MGGCGDSKRYSWVAVAASCFAGTLYGLSYNHVLATSKRAPEPMANREANFGTASHVLATSDNSLSRAAMAAMTRVANHGLAISLAEPTPLKISRVARRSRAASWQLPQAATCVRCADGQAALNSSTRTTSGRAAADSSSKSCNFLHSSVLFFSRFHIPASLLLLPWSSISALLRLAYHPAPSPKEPHFHRISIQIQNFRDLLDRKPFHFFQDQHKAVPFIQSFQQPLHALTRCDPLAQIGFVQQGSNLFLSEQVPALIHRDLIEPGAECRSLIKSLQREIGLNKNLLGDIFHVLAPSQDPARHRKYAVLMTPDQLLKRFLVLALRPANQFAIDRCASSLGGAPRHVPYRGRQVERLHFWDARHRLLVAAIISGLPAPASYFSLRRPEDFACFAFYPYGIIPS